MHRRTVLLKLTQTQSDVAANRHFTPCWDLSQTLNVTLRTEQSTNITQALERS